jgi:hypothetical protein
MMVRSGDLEDGEARNFKGDGPFAAGTEAVDRTAGPAESEFDKFGNCSVDQAPHGARTVGGDRLMSRGAQSFRQGDITRAIRALVKAGVKVGRVEITEGRIVVIAGQPEVAALEIETSAELRKLL